MSRLDDLRDAAHKASQDAKEQMSKIDTVKFQELVSELKKEGVDFATISQLEASISDVTKRNKLVTDLVEKGGNISKSIIKVLCKFI